MFGKRHEHLFSVAYDAGLQLHRELGPGLMESVYETVLASRLKKSGYQVERQRPVSITVDGITFPDAYRVDYRRGPACHRTEIARENVQPAYPSSFDIC